MNGEVREFSVEEGEGGRLDVCLQGWLAEISRSRLQAMIAEGLVTVNNRQAGKAGQRVQAGDKVRITIPPVRETELVAEAIPLEILFENKDVAVVNKAAGMVVHPAAGHTSGTLVHAALHLLPDLEGIGGELRPGVVHRLDKETSGLILLAKNERSHHWLQEQFRLRKVKKTYQALVDGRPPTRQGRIEVAIGRDSVNRKRMAAVTADKGREAVTLYETEEQFPAHTFLTVHPQTGRTHQIRVHLAFLGCPVVGDRLYGLRKPSLTINRHFLHARLLEVCLPGETVLRRFEAPLPQELTQLLNELRKT